MSFFNTRCALPKTARFEKSLFSKRFCARSPRTGCAATSRASDFYSIAITQLWQARLRTQTSVKTTRRFWTPTCANLKTSLRMTAERARLERTGSYQCAAAKRFQQLPVSLHVDTQSRRALYAKLAY